MASSAFKSATLNIYFEMGFDENGKPIKKRQTLQNIAQSTATEALLAVANAISTLYDGMLNEVELVSTVAID